MLAQTVVQVLTDAALFASADLQDRLLQMLALGDVDAGGDDVSRACPLPPRREVPDQAISRRVPSRASHWHS